MSQELKNTMVLKALLTHSTTLLDIVKFVEITNFKLNMVMFDSFWKIIVENTILLEDRVLEWFGYEGNLKIQKQKFIRMLKNNKIAYRELTQKDINIELYPSIHQEIQKLPSNIQHSNFLIMESDDIKKAIIKLKTKNSNVIRQYYIDLEKLRNLYVEYTLYFNEKKAQYEMIDLKQMIINLTEDVKKFSNATQNAKKSVRESEKNLKIAKLVV